MSIKLKQNKIRFIINFVLLSILSEIVIKTSFFLIKSNDLNLVFVIRPRFSLYLFFSMVFFAPILEEFLFRAILVVNRKTISLFSLGLFYSILSFFTPKQYLLFALAGCVILSLLIYINLKEKTILFLNKIKRNHLVIISTILFGVVHITNLDINHSSSFAIRIYVLAIMIGGLILSYIRIRYSLIIAIVFHSLHNLIPFISYWLL